MLTFMVTEIPQWSRAEAKPRVGIVARLRALPVWPVRMVLGTMILMAALIYMGIWVIATGRQMPTWLSLSVGDWLTVVLSFLIIIKKPIRMLVERRRQ